MNLDFTSLNLSEASLVEQKDETLFFKIVPIKYYDKRRPRLPRKSSKQTKLQIDTNHLFSYAFASITGTLNKEERFSIAIQVYKAKDGLGGGDLDNYCKAILDAITFTQKVWVDDKQVDAITIKRYTTENHPSSFIELTISKL